MFVDIQPIPARAVALARAHKKGVITKDHAYKVPADGGKSGAGLSRELWRSARVPWVQNIFGVQKDFCTRPDLGPGRTNEKLHLEPVVVGLTRSTGGLAALAACFGGEPPILRE
jgi:hypothetical protein